MKNRTHPLTEAPGLAENVLDCGGKRSATPLWNHPTASHLPTPWAARKRRRRSALPAQSNTWRLRGAASVLALLSTLSSQLSQQPETNE
jgi:hypothetical protein